MLGGKVQFQADLYEDGEQRDGNYIFNWKDDSIPQHKFVSIHIHRYHGVTKLARCLSYFCSTLGIFLRIKIVSLCVQNIYLLSGIVLSVCCVLILK